MFGKPGGLYHSSEDTPRISLPLDVSEETLAHELLHGVLCYKGYPGWNNGLRERFSYACDTAHEVCHCCVHIVIDQHLEELGYNVVTVKSAAAKNRITAIQKIGESVSDESGRHWWAIRASCEIARLLASPMIPPALTGQLVTAAEKHFPSSKLLLRGFCSITDSMNIDAPRNVQNAIWRMLQDIQLHCGKHPDYKALTKTAIITPLYVLPSQLRSPASEVIMLDEGVTTESKSGPTGRFLMLVHKFKGRTLSITHNLSERAFCKEKKRLHKLLKHPLRDTLAHCKIKYFELE